MVRVGGLGLEDSMSSSELGLDCAHDDQDEEDSDNDNAASSSASPPPSASSSSSSSSSSSVLLELLGLSRPFGPLREIDWAVESKRIAAAAAALKRLSS